MGYWTIAYGVTLHAEPEVYNKLKAKVPLTEKEGAIASYELKNQKYAPQILDVCKELGVSKQCQFDALVSFSFNLGFGVLNDRGSAIYKAIKKNINDRDGITKAFGLYVNAGDPPKPVDGLIRRRKEEANMFFGEYPKPASILIRNEKGYTGIVTENGGNGWLPDKC